VRIRDLIAKLALQLVNFDLVLLLETDFAQVFDNLTTILVAKDHQVLQVGVVKEYTQDRLNHVYVSILHDGVHDELALFVGAHVLQVVSLHLEQERDRRVRVQLDPILHHELAPPVLSESVRVVLHELVEQHGDAQQPLHLLHPLHHPAALLVLG